MLRWSKEDICKYQNNKLKELVVHAYKYVPYYTQLFDKHNIHPDSIQCYKDLQIIPPLTRKIIQENYEQLIDKTNYYKCKSRGSSSGSTGQALFYLHDEYGASAGIAAHYLGWQIGGYNFGDKGLHIWGNPAIVKNVWNKNAVCHSIHSIFSVSRSCFRKARGARRRVGCSPHLQWTPLAACDTTPDSSCQS